MAIAPVPLLRSPVSCGIVSAIMDSTREKIVVLLAQGFQPSVVAAACAVTPSWVTQVSQEDEVREAIALARSKKLEENAKVDATIDELEAAALGTLKNKLPYVRSPVEAAKVFSLLNKAIRRNSGVATTGIEGGTEVRIMLPKSVQGSVNIQINGQSQVVEVAGRSLAPMPSSALPALAASRAESRKLASAVTSATDIIATDVTARLAEKDSARAAELLRSIGKIQDITTTINGVQCVL